MLFRPNKLLFCFHQIKSVSYSLTKTQSTVDFCLNKYRKHGSQQQQWGGDNELQGCQQTQVVEEKSKKHCIILFFKRLHGWLWLLLVKCIFSRIPLVPINVHAHGTAFLAVRTALFHFISMYFNLLGASTLFKGNHVNACLGLPVNENGRIDSRKSLLKVQFA